MSNSGSRYIRGDVSSESSIYRQIELLNVQSREFEKLTILAQSEGYLAWIQGVSDLSKAQIQEALDQVYCDRKFRDQFADRLSILEEYKNAGDLRFHAVSLYLLIRARKPRLVVETGVAHGKSSSYILLALEHNQFGELVSIDLPATGGPSSDGSATSLEGHAPGWLVPDYLRSRWDFHLNDSIRFLSDSLPDTLGRNGRAPQVDFFFHDSLHTYDHVRDELQMIAPLLADEHGVAVDNIDFPGGQAFNDFLSVADRFAYQFSDFAAY